MTQDVQKLFWWLSPRVSLCNCVYDLEGLHLADRLAASCLQHVSLIYWLNASLFVDDCKLCKPFVPIFFSEEGDVLIFSSFFSARTNWFSITSCPIVNRFLPQLLKQPPRPLLTSSDPDPCPASGQASTKWRCAPPTRFVAPSVIDLWCNQSPALFLQPFGALILRALVFTLSVVRFKYEKLEKY